MSTPAQRTAMAKCILDFEARRDAQGHLTVYRLPPNDGGGEYEVAGINQRFDRPMADKLVALIGAGRFDEAEAGAIEYIAKNTDPAAKMTRVPSIESYLRDCVFNRGVKGATRILQRALNVEDDGEIGPLTKAAMAEAERNPQSLLAKLRLARESYERDVVGYRANFWKGLVNRWDKSLAVARTFPDTPESVAPAPSSPAPATNWLAEIIKWVLLLFKRPAPVQPPSPSDGVPPWLATMRSITGTHEVEGSGDNPVILAWRDEIARRFPEMATYCAEYTHDSIPWCGLTVAYCMAKSGIRPVFGSTPTERFFWADAWRLFGRKLDRPQLGCVMVFTRDGGGHVSLYEGEDGDAYLVRGGNQSDEVNVTRISKSKFTAAVWPE